MLLEDDVPRLAVPVEGGTEVYGVKGGKLFGVGWKVGGVLGGWGRWRSMNRVDVGVTKEEMWEEANWSMRLRYLIVSAAVLL